MDDDSSNLPRNRETTNNYYTSNGKLMLISLVVLVTICTIITFFHSFARWALHRRRNRDLGLQNYRRRRRSQTLIAADYIVFNFGPTITTTARKGLERSVLKSLPTFFYDSAAHGEAPLECAVCLSEFGENELGRVLPKCNHCFHIDCIDMWFYSHSNCPLCRAPVKPNEINPVHETKKPVSETGSSSGSVSTSLGSDDQMGGSSSSSPLLESQSIETKVEGISDPVCGVPNEVDTGSNSGIGLEDPGNQISPMTTKVLDRIESSESELPNKNSVIDKTGEGVYKNRFSNL